MTSVSVLIVDDQILLRQGLRKLLEIEEGIEIVGDAADGVEALEFLAAHPSPDVALVDARMPRMDGIELIARMRVEHPKVPAIVLTTFDDDELVFGGLRAGARGYLLKDVPPDELVSAIRRAARGETVLGGPAADRLVAALNTTVAPPPVSETATPLSDREWEVARMVGEGATNREIARALFITEGTAKNHVTSILRKLDLRDRTRLALWVGRQDT
ncbi:MULTISPECIES: response regulator [Nocardiopsis]|uniref:Bacterial regulatory s, luxR family protein n=1 Tax=Nocardiopsis alba (strain ATCC BAA-2165 / BE74) TaxID=1205910 RepID=J7LDR8_NOCAA|nr:MULTISPECIES: response regulator transcription factor [Nocardiopsis]AFR09535.1 bacterial regulatory s, luxR family protein [Nocardiopsis alba ATCC BAA-2165]MEC3892540.1 response regulator transcription factor [Nocardiopsis sp. LDBS1602]